MASVTVSEGNGANPAGNFKRPDAAEGIRRFQREIISGGRGYLDTYHRRFTGCFNFRTADEPGFVRVLPTDLVVGGNELRFRFFSSHGWCAY